MNRTWRSLYIYTYKKREFNEKKRRRFENEEEGETRAEDLLLARLYQENTHTHTHTHASTEDLSIDATRTDIERSWLPRTMEIIRACFCARNGHKLRQPIGKGTPVDQCQELVFIGKRKIRANVPLLIPFLIVSLPTSPSTKNREINGANFNFLLPTDRVPIRGALKFSMTAPGLFIADLPPSFSIPR